ncbi:MAG: matrixin family metalloprotease [Kofleriaceae bacterium]
MKRTSITLIVVGLGGCAVGADTESSTQEDSFETFLAETYREPWEGGHFIVNGDMAIPDEKQLFEYWSQLQQGALIVNRVGGADDRWNDEQKLELTYCVSNSFGANKSAMLAALEAATTQGWEARANVNFIHLAEHDANCTASNPNVLFDVRPVSGQRYLARAFFPSNNRASREVLVDSSSFGNIGWPLSNILAHELGHTLGFRHEHTRPEAATCFEDNSWRPLTSYDNASIMHYPQCNGASNNLDWSTRDAEGAAALYGAPGSQPEDPGDPEEPQNGVPMTDSASGTLALDAIDRYEPLAIVPGTTFTVAMTGTGDPDLYVRWDATPSFQQFNCRPYFAGAEETCSLTVPPGASQAYLMVHGYEAATYQLDVTWTAPQ